MTPSEPAAFERRRIRVIVLVDLLALGELFLAMYVAHANAEHFTPVFLAVFFGLLLPTLAVARRLGRPGSPELSGGG